MNRKSNVSFVRPEPAFIRKFKEGVGYSLGPTVETKKQQLAPVDSDSGPSDAEDEQPQVVVLRQGDLTAEEAAKFKQSTESSEKSEKSQPGDGKIVFRKPPKRSSDDKVTGVFATSSKKKKDDDSGQTEFKSSGNKSKQIKNSSLLSFGDDDDE
ncbi:uncharacterized protein KIAA1143 homolog [Pristis pectinata]|uniref:uncharacterized protein KIAA1143 homolog n=1 Tax=Pristis pectinata TaxID=685728 RepID=UPI00223D2ED2|nr:uncharacterized protein KIAA1143 homolog [Pristis pectinata]